MELGKYSIIPDNSTRSDQLTTCNVANQGLPSHCEDFLATVSNSLLIKGRLCGSSYTMRFAENQGVFETLVKIRTLIQCNAFSKPSENRLILY